VVRPSFDREVLWVDDSFDSTYPRDGEQDEFWMGLFDDSGRFGEGEIHQFEFHGEDDFYVRPVSLSLDELLRYRLVVWENRGWGYDGVSGLHTVTARNGYLATYLRAGGKLWVGGALTVASMLPAPGATALFDYPLEVDPGTFPHDFLKMATNRVHNAKGGTTPGTRKDDNMIGVLPFPGRPEIYPALEQDPDKISPFKGSISHGDAIFDPIFASDIAGFTGELDSLYVYQAVRVNRTFHNKLNALRWHDPDPARDQGRVQWFGFPLYYMKEEQAQETFNRSIDWFREETGP
jgi:hypothetical protein